MLRSCLLALFHIFSLLSASSVNAVGSSDRLQVSILTCEKSDRYVYAIFGHSAIRIRDIKKNTDIVFNYGTFDQGDPQFLLNFIHGKMRYFLSVSTYSSFLQAYIADGQAVLEQGLNLRHEEKARLCSLLKHQLKLENRFYQYDFVTSNCATKIVDLLSSSVGPDFEHSIASLNQGKGTPIREMLNGYLDVQSFYRFGINTLLGQQADTLSNKNVSLFLPDSLYHGLDGIYLKHGKLTQPGLYLFIPINKPISKITLVMVAFYAGYFILLILLLYCLFGGRFRLQTILHITDVVTIIVFGVISLAGCLLLYLSKYSDIALLKYNLNILWCHPFYMLLVFIRLRKYLCFIYLFCIAVYAIIYFNTIGSIQIYMVLTVLILLLSQFLRSGNQIIR